MTLNDSKNANDALEPIPSKSEWETVTSNFFTLAGVLIARIIMGTRLALPMYGIGKEEYEL